MSLILIAIGKVDPTVLEVVKNHLGKLFNLQVMLGKGISEPQHAFNKRRNQYRAADLLGVIMAQKEYNEYDRILGVIDRDLYEPQLNFVFGIASGRVAVISMTRLREEFYGLPENRTLFYKRVVTEAVHELGHTYGLAHCRNSECVMFFSNTLADTDRKGPNFCPKCKGELSRHLPKD
jgi:archaemetzincin